MWGLTLDASWMRSGCDADGMPATAAVRFLLRRGPDLMQATWRSLPAPAAMRWNTGQRRLSSRSKRQMTGCRGIHMNQSGTKRRRRRRTRRRINEEASSSSRQVCGLPAHRHRRRSSSNSSAGAAHCGLLHPVPEIVPAFCKGQAGVAAVAASRQCYHCQPAACCYSHRRCSAVALRLWPPVPLPPPAAHSMISSAANQFWPSSLASAAGGRVEQ